MCSSIRYAGRAIICSPSIVAMAALAIYALWQRDILGALLTPLAVVAIAADASTCAFIRRYLDRVAARAARADILASRLARAKAAGPTRALELEVLTSTVEQIAEHDRGLAEFLELDDLLERFAECCVDQRSHERALCAIRSPRYRAEVERRAKASTDELDAIGELVYLVAATAVLPPEVSAQGDLERVLAEVPSAEGRADLSQPPPSASMRATADVIC